MIVYNRGCVERIGETSNIGLRSDWVLVDSLKCWGSISWEAMKIELKWKDKFEGEISIL